MLTSTSPTLGLPPVLTYLLTRALADYRRAPEAATRATRLARLLRDTERYLLDAGATRGEIDAALEDTITVAHAADAA